MRSFLLAAKFAAAFVVVMGIFLAACRLLAEIGIFIKRMLSVQRGRRRSVGGPVGSGGHSLGRAANSLERLTFGIRWRAPQSAEVSNTRFRQPGDEVTCQKSPREHAHQPFHKHAVSNERH